MSGKADLAFLLDTNVWVDFFIDRGRNHDPAVNLVAAARTQDIPLFTSIETTKDVYYIVASELKRMNRESSGHLDDSFVRAVNETAWSCLSALRRHSTVVAADANDMIEAMVQRADHGDYEDNLVIAAARRASATHIVSSDASLQAHSPIPCIGIAQALDNITQAE